jgi:hypothetical protein
MKNFLEFLNESENSFKVGDEVRISPINQRFYLSSPAFHSEKEFYRVNQYDYFSDTLLSAVFKITEVFSARRKTYARIKIKTYSENSIKDIDDENLQKHARTLVNSILTLDVKYLSTDSKSEIGEKEFLALKKIFPGVFISYEGVGNSRRYKVSFYNISVQNIAISSEAEAKKVGEEIRAFLKEKGYKSNLFSDDVNSTPLSRLNQEIKTLFFNNTDSLSEEEMLHFLKNMTGKSIEEILHDNRGKIVSDDIGIV